jgi:hypothetical protein
MEDTDGDIGPEFAKGIRRCVTEELCYAVPNLQLSHSLIGTVVESPRSGK